MHRWLSFLFLFTIACASQLATRPANVPQPEIEPMLTNPLFFGSGSSAPANIDVVITNRASIPITVRRIEIDSPGMAMYSLVRTQRDFRETIPAGGTKTLTVFATAVTRTSRPSEPLTLRAIVEFEAETHAWREIVMTR